MIHYRLQHSLDGKWVNKPGYEPYSVPVSGTQQFLESYKLNLNERLKRISWEDIVASGGLLCNYLAAAMERRLAQLAKEFLNEANMGS